MKTTEFNLSKTQKTIIISLFLLIFAFPIFYKLNKIPLLRWDESLYAQCAFELAHTGKSQVKWDSYFLTDEPLYVSKPPLVMWLQAVFMKIFGYDSLLAIRLHSAIATVLTLLLLVYFSWSEFKSIFLGLFSGLVLITTNAYLYFHIVRSGDMDGLLIFFTTLMVLFYYKYLKYFDDRKVRNKNLAIVTFALIGGVMTKTAAAFFFVPGLFIYTIFYKKRFINMLKLRSTYFAIASFIVVIGGYYFIKELTTPGNLQHLWEHDLGGRFFTTIMWSKHPYFFYIQYIFTSVHTPWLFFVPLSILLFFLVKDKDIKEFFIFSAVCVVVYLIIISCANTKITWYMAQIYPLAAIIVGLSIYYMFVQLYKIIDQDHFIIKLLFLVLFIIAIFFSTYYDRIQEIQSFVQTDKVHMGETYDIYEDCLSEMRNSKNSIKNFTVFHEVRDSLMSWNPQLIFYQKVYNEIYGFNINVSYDPNVFRKGDVVLANKNSADQVLSQYYDYDVILAGRDSEFIRITGRKNSPDEFSNNS